MPKMADSPLTYTELCMRAGDLIHAFTTLESKRFRKLELCARHNGDAALEET